MKRITNTLTADAALLRQLVARQGVTMEWVCRQLGIHRTTLYRHVQECRLRPREMVGLCRILALSDREADALFLGKKSQNCDKSGEISQETGEHHVALPPM